ncbi:MAG: B12-binding domain-containing radical SAM protein [Acidobacteriota bacterium]
MKLVLYNPPSSAQRKPVLPMSLLALAAVLETEHDVAIVDGNLDDHPFAAVDARIREWGAELLAVTVMPGPQVAGAVPLSRAVKARHPAVPVVWGGYFPTLHPEPCLADPAVDFVVRGHGEQVFADLVSAIASGADPRAVPGLASRAPGGAVQLNPLAAIPHPDMLPDFPYRLVDVDRYVRRTFMGERTLPHHSSYGCPFLCNFCAVVNMVSGRWLAQSAMRTAAVTERLVREFGADSVEFYDNNFFVSEARTVEFAERIRPLGISWWGEARIDTLLRFSARSWGAMRGAGLKMVFLGAESGSDETLKHMNKGGSASAEKTLEIAGRMREFGIVPELSFVLGSPPDPAGDIERTLTFITRVKRVNPAAEIVLYLYSPVPLAGDLYDQASSSGFVFPATLDEWLTPTWQEFAQHRSTSLPWLPRAATKRIRGFERVLNAYYPTVTDTRLGGGWRWLLKGLSAWRYHLRIYRHPVELAALQRLLGYQRPETSGF